MKEWTPEAKQYLIDNHRRYAPKEMAQHLGVKTERARRQMFRMNLKIYGTMIREQKDRFVNMLTELGAHKDLISEVTGLNPVTVGAMMFKSMKDDYNKTTSAYSSDNKAHQYPEILEIKRLELNNFIPDHEEDERWNYSDLSPSEKLIYHFIKPDYLIDFKAHVQGFNQTNKIQFKVISEKEIESERINGYEYAI